jgi:hypothetical protein
MSTWSAADFQRHIEFMIGVAKDLGDRGEFVLAEGLDFPTNARVVTNKGGPPVVSDGPFPESKEFLAGFWTVDVAKPERAVAIAAVASAAALAGTGQGEDAAALDEEARAGWRRQALDWLTAELAARKERAARDPKGSFQVLDWRNDGDLVAVRDPSQLAKLPPAEQEAFHALWRDVEAIVTSPPGGR